MRENLAERGILEPVDQYGRAEAQVPFIDSRFGAGAKVTDVGCVALS